MVSGFGDGIFPQVTECPTADCGWTAAGAIQHDLFGSTLSGTKDVRPIGVRTGCDQVPCLAFRTFHAIADAEGHTFQTRSRQDRSFYSRYRLGRRNPNWVADHCVASIPNPNSRRSICLSRPGGRMVGGELLRTGADAAAEPPGSGIARNAGASPVFASYASPTI